MVHSMTGFGAASYTGESCLVEAEARSVNGRFLKVQVRTSHLLSGREHELEALVRAHIQRGTVNLVVNLRRTDAKSLVSINEAVVRAYQAEFARLDIPDAPLATLPGVLQGTADKVSDDEWVWVTHAVNEALEKLVAMRRSEGADLHRILLDLCDRMKNRAARIAARAPAVVREYQDKLQRRLTALLPDDVAMDPAVLAREVAVLAERCDIQEEVDRCHAHLMRIHEVFEGGGEVGRSLEFLAQELHREANTMGSKSADATLAHEVVALKADIERFKEQAANIE